MTEPYDADVTVYDIATQLPSIEMLRQRCKALAMLDAIIGGDYYTYDRAWGANEAASMRNGSGEEYDVVFTADGVFIRGLYHESPMFEYTGEQPWPRLLDGRSSIGLMTSVTDQSRAAGDTSG
jgi:hypothetical protein